MAEDHRRGIVANVGHQEVDGSTGTAFSTAAIKSRPGRERKSKHAPKKSKHFLLSH
jgi:hypothetical protein